MTIANITGFEERIIIGRVVLKKEKIENSMKILINILTILYEDVDDQETWTIEKIKNRTDKIVNMATDLFRWR